MGFEPTNSVQEKSNNQGFGVPWVNDAHRLSTRDAGWYGAIDQCFIWRWRVDRGDGSAGPATRFQVSGMFPDKGVVANTNQNALQECTFSPSGDPVPPARKT